MQILITALLSVAAPRAELVFDAQRRLQETLDFTTVCALKRHKGVMPVN